MPRRRVRPEETGQGAGLPTPPTSRQRAKAPTGGRAIPPPPAAPMAVAEVIRRESAAWMSCVLATLEYCRTTAEVPERVLETLRPFRHGVDEAVETGRVLRELAPAQLSVLAAEITSLDHAEIRRCAREVLATQRVTTNIASTLTAALLRGLRPTS